MKTLKMGIKKVKKACSGFASTCRISLHFDHNQDGKHWFYGHPVAQIILGFLRNNRIVMSECIYNCLIKELSRYFLSRYYTADVHGMMFDD